MAAVPAKYPPPVPVRRTAGAQPTSPAKRTPQNFVIPLKPVLPHVTDCEVDEKLRLEESLYSAESLVREKPPLSDDNVQDYPREVYNIRQGRRQVEEIELLEEPMAQQGQQLLNASESSMSAESSDRGPSVFETTQMDADKFEAEIDEPFYDRKVGRDRGGKPWLARDFLLCLRIIVFVSCLLCLWPFSCICLCCAYGCRRRVSVCMHTHSHDKNKKKSIIN